MRLLPVLALLAGSATLAWSQTPTKVGIINIQQAIVGTRDGQAAVKELQAKAEPRRKSLQALQDEINGLRDKMQKGSNTLSAEAKEQIQRDMESRTRTLNRNAEDAEAEFGQEQNRLLQGIAGNMQAVIDKYARDNAYTLVLDVSSQQTPVIFATDSIDITRDVVALYDKNAPGAGAAPAGGAPATAAPVKPTGAAPGQVAPGTLAPAKPAAPAVVKPKPGAVK